jgi:hypothetical protein
MCRENIHLFERTAMFAIRALGRDCGGLSGELFFTYEAGLLVASGCVVRRRGQLRRSSRRSSNPMTQADRIRTAGGPNCSGGIYPACGRIAKAVAKPVPVFSCGPGIIALGENEEGIAHFPLDILDKGSVCGDQRSLIGSKSKGPLPPPAPFGLRGVAVVQRDCAPRPREEPI